MIVGSQIAPKPSLNYRLLKPTEFSIQLVQTWHPFFQPAGGLLCAESSESLRNAMSVPILIEGLRRLEYRGYDSAGIAVLGRGPEARRMRAVGKVKVLEEALERRPRGTGGHRAHPLGDPRRADPRNAHPHISRDGIAIVHNGIIENHEALRAGLQHLGYSSIGDRYRGDRASDPSSPGASRRILRGGAHDGRELRGRLRAGGDQRSRTRRDRPRARGLPGGRRARHR